MILEKMETGKIELMYDTNHLQSYKSNFYAAFKIYHVGICQHIGHHRIQVLEICVGD